MPCSICKQSKHNRLTCVNNTNTILPKKYTKGHGKTCLHKGMSYENQIMTKLCGFSYDGSPIRTISDKTGGATSNPDIQLYIGNIQIRIECKNKNGFEAGGKCMKIINNELKCPDGTLHNDVLNGRTPWSGRIPSFINGDKSLHTWNREKQNFRDEYYRILPDVISAYYKSKSVDYIQVEEKGLYHTGNDVLCLGVPLFECRARIRIRCKQHGSTPMPSSVQAVFTFDKRSLGKSKYDIDNKLPGCFTTTTSI